MTLKYLIDKEIEALVWDKNALKFENVYRKRVIGDGSCYFHAIIDSYFLPIRTGMIGRYRFDRFDFVKKFRNDLSRMLCTVRPGYGGKTYYQTLSRGELNDNSKCVPEVSIENMMSELNSNTPVSYIYHELVSDILNLDIYILDADKKDVYMIDSDFELYHKGRNSIILLYIPGHFELIGEMRNNELKTYFRSNDALIVKIKKRMHSIKTKLKKDIISIKK